MSGAQGSPQYSETLESHDDAFSRLMGLIPARFYVSRSDAEVRVIASKYEKNKRTKSQKQKEAEERKAMTKASRRAKLDPDRVKSVQEVQEERKQDASLNPDDDENDDEVEDSDDMDGDYEDMDDDHLSDTEPKPALAPAAPDTKPLAARRVSIAELRERLHNKIEQLHQKRNPQGASSDASAPLSTKQDLLEERRRQRGEMRDRRRRERKESRRQSKLGTKPDTKPSISNAKRQTGLLVEDTKTSAPKLDNADVGNVAFSQVSFDTDVARKNKFALPSDPKSALSTLEARKRRAEAKIQKQVERGQDGAQARESLQESQRWGKALAAAEGVRIRDNEHFLKQTIKRREKTKAKSTKAWNDRRHAEQEAQAAKQKKRMENITNRHNPKGKGKKAAPSKARPGFEGAQRSFGARKTKR
ncbi:hypothetical protein MVES1_001137 [Malassezia vespertilionis]|nr:uncharacterized protein MVES1_001137 [Malassezia vespertilionis]WFD05803.1 hypothetical protein MVES1_001137 [Malassezia vespertilionis]